MDERFVDVENVNEDIIFDDCDMILDCESNRIYGSENLPDLIDLLNGQDYLITVLKKALEFTCRRILILKFGWDEQTAIENLMNSYKQQAEEELKGGTEVQE